MRAFTPPVNVVQNARLAIRIKKTFVADGMSAFCMTVGKLIAKRYPLDLKDIERMTHFFAEQQVKKQTKAWNQWDNSRLEWEILGGEQGRAWAERIFETYG